MNDEIKSFEVFGIVSDIIISYRKLDTGLGAT